MSNDFERYAAKLRGIPAAVKAVQPEAARAGALIIRAEIDARAPVDSGDLKSSIKDEPGEVGANSAEHKVVVGAFYARWVERGHGGPKPAPAHPFVRPALDHKEDEAKEVIVRKQMDALKGAMQ